MSMYPEWKLVPNPPVSAQDATQDERPVIGEERPYCYALETRGLHGGKSDVLLNVEYNKTDSFSGGRKGGVPLYRRPAPDAGDAQLLAALKQAHMALIGFMPQHRNAVIVNAIVAAHEAIDAAIAQQNSHRKA